jgi:hypothetical protein
LFGEDKYKYLLKKIIDNKLLVSTDWQQPLIKNKILIRHDIDFSISAAVKIAKIEKDFNIQSTFFFMLTSNMYTLSSKVNIEHIKEIKNYGHKISLHYDPTVYYEKNSFLNEKNFFENLFDVNIDIVSIHRPGIFLENNNQNLCGVPHTYQDRFFKDMAYISDSAGNDVNLKIDQYLERQDSAGLQLLIHPIWWSRDSESPTSTLDQWLNENTSFIQNEIRANCRTYTS